MIKKKEIETNWFINRIINRYGVFIATPDIKKVERWLRRKTTEINSITVTIIIYNLDQNAVHPIFLLHLQIFFYKKI